MADYRDMAAALSAGYGQDTGPITADTLITLKNGKTASAGDLLGMLKGYGQSVGSNLESLVRGGVASVPGMGGDLESLGRAAINKLYGAGGVNVSPNPVLPTSTDILGMMPRMTAPRRETAGMEELGGYMTPATAKLAGKAIKATEGLPVGMSIKPINLNKGIYKPELTMEEMLKVKDIPTVDRVRQSIDLVGEKEFERMVNAQYSKYKPSDVDQEAMLVESVTLDILGKAQRSPYPQQAALDLAQQRAALPKSESGLGLPVNNTPEMRYQAMKGVEGNFVHGSKNPDIEKFKTRKQIFEESANDPNRAIAENHYANERNAVFASSDPEFTTAFSQHGYTDVGQAPTSYPLRMIGGNKVFDFENPSHLNMLKQKYAEMFPVKTIGREGYVPSEESIRMHTINKRIENLPNDTNNWPAIESQDFQKAIRELGFDAFHVNERGTKNIGVYDPSSLRSPFAAYDPFRKDVATATAMGVALPDLLAAEKQDKQKKNSK